jgi:hypothetical protein
MEPIAVGFMVLVGPAALLGVVVGAGTDVPGRFLFRRVGFRHARPLRPAWTALAAFGVALSLGLLNLSLFGLSLRAPLLAALGAGVCLILLLIRGRRL